MAEAIPSNQDLFMCPVCLDLLQDPVTLNCGHNYCKECINHFWDHEDQTGAYSCPQCRQTFSPRPVLHKNTVFAELVEQIRKTRIEVPVQSLAGPGEVECDSCPGRKRRAVKSCLVCLASFCETHLQCHDELFMGEIHTVVDITGQPDPICIRHQKLLELFCRTDQSCVCLLCLTEEHEGHDTVSATAERTEKQKQLGEIKRRFQMRIQGQEKKQQEMWQAVKTLKNSAQMAVEDCERIFTEMICSIERRRSEIIQMIRAQEKSEVSQAEGLLERLDQEIAELKRRDAELEQLYNTDDHIHFLKNFQSAISPLHSMDLSNVLINQSVSFEALLKYVSTMKNQLVDFCQQDVVNASTAVSGAQAIFVEPVTREDLLKISDVQAIFAEPVTRDDYLKYSGHFTLDPNTAHRTLYLSEENRMVECTPELQSYPDHPERFNLYYQVLCREGVMGCSYWEVECSGLVDIAVTYKSFSRKDSGKEYAFGWNDQSWSLVLASSRTSFWHNNKRTNLPLVDSSRIGVYVDHKAGTLAFYTISDSMTLLHSVHTTFTHTLYPGFCIGPSGSVKLLSLK